MSCNVLYSTNVLLQLSFQALFLSYCNVAPFVIYVCHEQKLKFFLETLPCFYKPKSNFQHATEHSSPWLWFAICATMILKTWMLWMCPYHIKWELETSTAVKDRTQNTRFLFWDKTKTSWNTELYYTLNALILNLHHKWLLKHRILFFSK